MTVREAKEKRRFLEQAIEREITEFCKDTGFRVDAVVANRVQTVAFESYKYVVEVVVRV